MVDFFFPKWLYHLHSHKKIFESSTCSAASPTFSVFPLSSFCHSNECVVVSHVLNFQFLRDSDVEKIFLCLTANCTLPFVKYLFIA